MSDQNPIHAPGQQQGQADHPSSRMTTQVVAQGSGAEGQVSQSGGLVPAGQQTELHVQAVGPEAVDQPERQHVPVQAVRRERPTPVLEASVIESRERGFGGASIRIMDRGIAATAIVGAATIGASYVASQATQSPAGIVGAGFVAGAMTLATFYLSNKQQTEEAIRKAVERERHIQVENIEEGSLLVRVKFLTLAGYWVLRTFNEKIHQGTDRTCLQLLLEDELQRVGWTGLIQVGLEGWWFADEEGQEEEQEGSAGTEQGERWEWAGMVEKQSVPPSETEEGDSCLPEDVSSVAAMSIASVDEVEEGPLMWLRALLQKQRYSPIAQRHIKAYRSWEEGAYILTNSGYADLGGVVALVKGLMQPDTVLPSDVSTILYGQSWLNLNKAKLMQLITSRVQADPTDSTCLLLTAMQLPNGDSRLQTLQQVVAAILQHGPGDWLYQHLHRIYCYLAWAIYEATPEPTEPALAKALSAMASSLMYKQDHLGTVYSTALLTKKVSETEAIRQFEHLIKLAQEFDYFVSPAHYHLAILYKQKQDRENVIHHFTRGQQTEAYRLPVFIEVSRIIKDPATKAYEQVISKESK